MGFWWRASQTNQQSVLAVAKTNCFTGFKNLASKTRDVITPLYSVLFKPCLEYCVQFWSSQFKRHTGKLKRVQKRASMMIRGLENLTQEERLKNLGLFGLRKNKFYSNHSLPTPKR